MSDFQSYITYDEYTALGGSLSEEVFTLLERKAQRWLDYFTFNRIPLLTTIPDVVKEVLVEFIGRVNFLNQQKDDGDTITQYSNTVETITYNRKTDAEARQELYQLALDWLPDYLVCRSVSFDVTKYLQSDDNDSEQT